MKLRTISTLILSAAMGLSMAAAQEKEESSSPKLLVNVMLPGEKPQMLVILKADAEGNFYYKKRNSELLSDGKPSSCRMFFIQTPVELAETIAAYQEGDVAAARKKGAACRKKYSSFKSLPGNPASLAAVYELSSAVRLMDWEEVAKLVKSFPSVKTLTAAQQARVAAAAVMAGISDDPASYATQRKAIAELLNDKKFVAGYNSEVYSWLRYALARAGAARIPADKQAATLSEEHADIADAAIDNYCQCAVSAHGSNMAEIPADAMLRAMKLLWVMPGVQDYAAKAKAPMDAKAWGSAPHNFRDAVAIAYLLKNVYGPKEPDATVAKLAEFYYNTAKDNASDK